jgi:hypothetical protein
VLRPAANRPSPAARRGSFPTLPRRVESVGLADRRGVLTGSPRQLAGARCRPSRGGWSLLGCRIGKGRSGFHPLVFVLVLSRVATVLVIVIGSSHGRSASVGPRSILIGWATNGRMFATVFRSTMSLAPLKHHRRLRACIDTHRGCSRIRRGLECCDRLRSRAPLR